MGNLNTFHKLTINCTFFQLQHRFIKLICDQNWLLKIVSTCFCSETNLKCRQPLVETAEMGDDIDEIKEFDGKKLESIIMVCMVL